MLRHIKISQACQKGSKKNPQEFPLNLENSNNFPRTSAT